MKADFEAILLDIQKNCGFTNCKSISQVFWLTNQGESLMESKMCFLCEDHATGCTLAVERHIIESKLSAKIFQTSLSKPCAYPKCPETSTAMLVMRTGDEFDALFACSIHEPAMQEAVKLLTDELSKAGLGFGIHLTQAALRSHINKELDDGR